MLYFLVGTYHLYADEEMEADPSQVGAYFLHNRLGPIVGTPLKHQRNLS